MGWRTGGLALRYEWSAPARESRPSGRPRHRQTARKGWRFDGLVLWLRVGRGLAGIKWDTSRSDATPQSGDGAGLGGEKNGAQRPAARRGAGQPIMFTQKQHMGG